MYNELAQLKFSSTKVAEKKQQIDLVVLTHHRPLFADFAWLYSCMFFSFFGVFGWCGVASQKI
jgi:hypothetical protein